MTSVDLELNKQWDHKKTVEVQMFHFQDYETRSHYKTECNGVFEKIL